MKLETENMDEVRLLQEYRKASRMQTTARLEVVLRGRELQRIAISVITTAYVRSHRDASVLTGDEQS